MRVNHAIVLSLVLLVTASCSNRSSGPVNKYGNPIIADHYNPNTAAGENLEFPGGIPRFIALINLNEPALLSSAILQADGKTLVDEDLKQRIQNEQNSIIKQLQAISADIKVLQSYKMVLNAITIEAPQSVADQINDLRVDLVEANERFSRPVTLSVPEAQRVQSPLQYNTMTFLGVEDVHNQLTVMDSKGVVIPVRGQGIRVGVIDSGIDYTHSMFGGPANSDIFKSLDNVAPNEYFPNNKVVGGYDFAGSRFKPGSHLYSENIPSPDHNPLDRSGHGTHVAGTVAGVGDGVNTFNGAAPDAQLFALKVFGDDGGGTDDALILAALEYAADPNGDLDPNDALDVVNLSLGGGFGKPHDLYSLAVKNVTNGGIVVVAAAGNSGALTSVIGAPSTADDAISVAASVDGMDHNWRFPAIKVQAPTLGSLLIESVEGYITAPTSQVGNVTGELVAVGLADKDLTPELKKAIVGKVALLERGLVSFTEKIRRVVDAGALGVVMINNTDEPPFVMGGEEFFPIPGVMISRAMGQQIQGELKKGSVAIEFKPSEMIEKPELIDQIADFSSQGPRDLDALIKPEITAPGVLIISAEMGSGEKGIPLYGTSMASPIVAGVAALLVQYRPELKPRQIKSMLVNTSKPLKDAMDKAFPVSRQGAGRLQAMEAIQSPVALEPTTFSLGKLSVSETMEVYKEITIENITDKNQQYVWVAKPSENLQAQVSESVTVLAPGEKKTVSVQFTVAPPSVEFVEVDTVVEIYQGETRVGVIPVLAVIERTSLIQLDQLTMGPPSDSSTVKTASLSVTNRSAHPGQMFLFNLIGKDERKDASKIPSLDIACDLESAGYRIIQQGAQRFLQIAFKLYNPVTHWNACDLLVQIDTNNDKKPDFDLYGSLAGYWPGLSQLPVPGFASLLFDSQKLADINSNYEKEVAQQLPQPPQVNYMEALVGYAPMAGFSNSTLAILTIDARYFPSDIQVRLMANFNSTRNNAESQDVLNLPNGDWSTLSLQSNNVGFEQLPPIVLVPEQSTIQTTLVRGQKKESLIGYFPRNPFVTIFSGQDQQSQTIEAVGL